MELETRKCNVCGEEWPDTGDKECFFCGSIDTDIVEEEDHTEYREGDPWQVPYYRDY